MSVLLEIDVCILYDVRIPVGCFRSLFLLLIVIGTVYEHNGIGILLDGAGFTEIRQLRCVIVSLRRASRQLRQGKYRHAEILSQDLQISGYRRYFFVPRLFVVSGQGNELEIVDHYESGLCLGISAKLGELRLHGHRVGVRIVIYDDGEVRQLKQGRIYLALLPIVNLLGEEYLIDGLVHAGREQSVAELFLRHLEREYRYRNSVRSHIGCDVYGKRCLTHTGPCRKYVKRTGS